MVSSLLEQYRIADFLEWDEKRQLKLNPDFQRRNIWTKSAKAFLIDTILRRLPIPKIYMRTRVDLKTKRSFREIVDGQQRLRAILDFSKDKLVLTKHTEEFAGLRYSDLEEEQQEIFLSYPIAVEQFVNAGDADILEVFARLNTYTVSLNAAELRHATHSGNFRWAVHNTSKRWGVLWETYKVVSVRQRLRMMDDSLISELFGVILAGVTDGGQTKINKLYAKHKDVFPEEEMVVNRINETLSFITENLEDVLVDSSIARAPHFYVLFAAVAHRTHGIPQGGLVEMPPRSELGAIGDMDIVKENLSKVNSIIEAEEPPPSFREFWNASKGTTHRIASRRIRFPSYLKALGAEPLEA